MSLFNRSGRELLMISQWAKNDAAPLLSPIQEREISRVLMMNAPGSQIKAEIPLKKKGYKSKGFRGWKI